MHERLAAGEVQLLHAQRQPLGHAPADLLARHQGMTVHARTRGHEAVRALQVAQGARDLDPQRVEVEQGLFGPGPRKGGRGAARFGIGSRNRGHGSGLAHLQGVERSTHGRWKRIALTRRRPPHNLTCSGSYA